MHKTSEMHEFYLQHNFLERDTQQLRVLKGREVLAPEGRIQVEAHTRLRATRAASTLFT